MRFSPYQRKWLFGAVVSILLAIGAATLLNVLLAQWHPRVDLQALGITDALSERSRATLADTSGTISVTCIFPVDSPIGIPVGRLLRTFAQNADAQGGATLEIGYIDPQRDTGSAAQLIAQGAQGTGLLFRQAGRRVFIPEASLLSTDGRYAIAEAENAITSALARLSRTDGLVLGWLMGHGEPDFASTDPSTGFSGLRRALENEGCQLKPLTLDITAPEVKILDEISVLLIVAPRYPITTAERTAIHAWIERGGRLFYALPPSGDAGLGSLLERWGIQVGTQPRQPARQSVLHAGMTRELSKEHAITRELAGHASVFFCAPRALRVASFQSISAQALVKMEVLPLEHATDLSDITVMAASERGGAVGEDLAFRPGRIVVMGEVPCIENAFVLNHATANRDLTLNALRWLTGLTGSTARSGMGVNLIDQDARAWRIDFLVLAGAVPLGLCLVLWCFTRRRA